MRTKCAIFHEHLLATLVQVSRRLVHRTGTVCIAQRTRRARTAKQALHNVYYTMHAKRTQLQPSADEHSKTECEKRQKKASAQIYSQCEYARGLLAVAVKRTQDIDEKTNMHFSVCARAMRNCIWLCEPHRAFKRQNRPMRMRGRSARSRSLQPCSHPALCSTLRCSLATVPFRIRLRLFGILLRTVCSSRFTVQCFAKSHSVVRSLLTPCDPESLNFQRLG